MKRKLVALFSAVLLMAGVYTVVEQPAGATAPGASSYWTYGASSGEIDLFPGAANANVVLPAHGACHAKWVLQGDGNLVMYDTGVSRWSSHTNGQNDVLKMQGDGNVVIYHVDGQGHSDGVVLWASGTHVPSPPTPLTLQMFDNAQWSIQEGPYPYAPMGYGGKIFDNADIC